MAFLGLVQGTFVKWVLVSARVNCATELYLHLVLQPIHLDTQEGMAGVVAFRMGFGLGLQKALATRSAVLMTRQRQRQNAEHKMLAILRCVNIGMEHLLEIKWRPKLAY